MLLGDLVFLVRARPFPFAALAAARSRAATPSVLRRSHSCRLAESSASCAAVRLVDPGREIDLPPVAGVQSGSERAGECSGAVGDGEGAGEEPATGLKRRAGQIVGLEEALRLGLPPLKEKASSANEEVEAVGEGGQWDATGEREGRRKGAGEVEAAVDEIGAETRKGWLLGVGHGIWYGEADGERARWSESIV